MPTDLFEANGISLDSKREPVDLFQQAGLNKGQVSASSGVMPEAEMTESPRQPLPEETVPEWGRKNPNLYGLAGVGKQYVKAIPETVGIALGSLASPLLGPSLGYGMGKKVGEISEREYGKILGEEPEYKSLPAEIGESALDVGGTFVLGKGMDVAGKALFKTEDMIAKQLSSTIKEGIRRGIRPSVSGKGNFPQAQKYYKQAETAVRAIIDNKPNLKLTDENGAIIEGLPKSLREFSEAIHQTKGKVFEKYDEMARQAGDAGSRVKFDGIIKELKEVISDKVIQDQNPAAVRHALEKLQTYQDRGEYSILEAQKAISAINEQLKPYYKAFANGNVSLESISVASIEQKIANKMREALDDAVTDIKGPGYQELKNVYGSLRNIEKEVAHRAEVAGRQNKKGFFDITNVFSGGTIVGGLLSLNPKVLATGAAMRGISEYTKYINNPNRIIRGMFKDADKLIQKTGMPGPISGVSPPSAPRTAFDELTETIQGKPWRQGEYKRNWQPEEMEQIKAPMASNAYASGAPENMAKQPSLRPDQLSRVRPVRQVDQRIEDTAAEMRGVKQKTPDEIPTESYAPGKPESFPQSGKLRPDQKATREVPPAKEVRIEDTVKEMSATAERNKATAQGILKAEFPGMEKEITRAVREEPELTRIIKRSGGKPTEKDKKEMSRIALKKINEFRKKKGIKLIELGGD